MRSIIWILLLSGGSALPLPAAGSSGFRAQFVGSTLEEIPAKTDGDINFTGQESLVVHAKKTVLHIPYDRIDTIEYGQRVSRRFAEAALISPLLLLSKSRKHYVSVIYRDEKGSRQAIVFRLDKDDVRAVLAGLDTKTGRKVEYQDDEARKSGKG